MKTYRLSLLLIIFGFAFASSALAQSAQMSPTRAPSLFVPARYSDIVSAINTSTNQVVTQIPVAVGRYPIRVTMTLDGLKALVSDDRTASSWVISTCAL